MRWYVKAAIQYILAVLPGGMRVNDALSRRIGELSQMDEHVADRLGVLLKLVNTSARHVDFASKPIAVEIGTGWTPLLPILLGLKGATVHTFDINRFLVAGNIRRMLDILRHHTPAIASSLDLSEEDINSRINEALDSAASGSVNSILQPFNVIYTAPSDATVLPIETHSVDLYVSNLVCAHIPRPLIPEVLAETGRVLKDGAHAIHRIRLSDELAAADPKSHELNFLKFPSPFYQRFINTRIKYLNRLRCSEWKKAFADAGFELVASEEDVSRTGLEHLKTMKLAPEFQGFEHKDLATTLIVGVWRKLQTAGARTKRASEHSAPSRSR